jgi:hypothetical protein
MITSVCQRWCKRRSAYRPAGEPIRSRDYDVALIASDAAAREFVIEHHYAASYVAARLRVGLYRGGELVGVAVLSQPASQAALDAALPIPGAKRAELGRFVLLDDVPSNGESWFLARTWELARAEGFEAVVSHADPAARATRDGKVVFPGHVGTIYQATNALYVGRTPRRTWRLFDDGTVLSARALSKLRARECGWQNVVEQLVRRGAPPPAGDWRTWQRRAVAATTRPVRHPGTHRYLFALEQRVLRHLPHGERYPKLDERARQLAQRHAAGADAQTFFSWF